MYYLYLFLRPTAQQRFAADAAGAAPDLGATFWRGGAPAHVPVSGGRQQRRWKLAVGHSAAVPRHPCGSVLWGTPDTEHQ